MPLIIICGTPVSGKTTRANELKEYFEKTRGKRVNLVSEEEAISKLGYEKNLTYLDSQKEKRLRDYLKSEVIRLLGKENVVILDGSNYIKGYRYELYCATKASKCTQCTVYTICNYEDAWQANLQRKREIENKGNNVEMKISEPYTEEVFNALTKLRFEEPDPNNRWDSPLCTVQPPSSHTSLDNPHSYSEQELPSTLNLDEIHKMLFENKPPPPNMSTQNPPLSSTNFLYELDKVTQAISKQIVEAKQLNLDGELKFRDYSDCTLEPGFVQFVNPQKLLMLRRQFLTYAKMNHSNENAITIGRYFIQYLNKTLRD